MKHLWLIALLIGFALHPLWAQETAPQEDDALFRSAVVFLSQGEDQKALSHLSGLSKDSFGSLYNKGLAYRNLGDLPRARASFEKALLLSPRSLATRRRLRELRGRMDSELPPLDVRWTPWWSKSEAEVLLLLPILALFGMGILRRRGREIRRTALVGAMALEVLLFAGFWFTNPPAERAIILEESTQLLPSPESGKTGTRLMAGQLVEVMGNRKHYLEIRLGDGQTGWVRAAKLERL